MKITDLSQHNNVLRQKLLPFISGLIFAWDILAVTGAYLVSLHLLNWLSSLGYTPQQVSPIMGQERLYIFLSLAIIMLFAFANKGHYTRRVPWWGQVPFMLKGVVIAFLVDGFLSFSLQRSYSPIIVSLNWASCAILLILCRNVALHLASRMNHWSLPTVLLGDKNTVTQAFNALCADGETGYNIHTILLEDEDRSKLDMSKLPRACTAPRTILSDGSYVQYILNNPDNFYLIQLSCLEKTFREELVRLLETNHIQHAIIPSMQQAKVYNVEPHFFFGNDFVIQHTRVNESPLFERFCKRGLDVLLSSFAVALLAIITPIIFLLKKAEGSQTPVFYNGARVGRNGELFPCWKFCTMRTDGDEILAELLENDAEARAEWNAYQKLRNDPRIDSRVSAFLRKTSLDELPQLWNVFVGDMSLVGPRPILPTQTQEYGRSLHEYKQVRPGLTGLWQVSGRNETTFAQRINWDSWYIRNWSVWNDIVILFKTVRVLFSGSGAY
ncbi:MAG: exopolysaccharide biosynthesis polyprenyl glycosylphosphotransferase [Alphaproteobacteria bacterium]|nr:exopolysaccharide biosynthesis polyprenyl glycosylphosphotransferase [Alphaproteobacteria bacterium]